MPRVAKLLPIPRRYDAKGIERYGFHGLSYTYLMKNSLVSATRRQKRAASSSRISATAQASPLCVMEKALIPAWISHRQQMVMSTRSGDLDPAVASYLVRAEKLTTGQFYEMVNHESGLLGVSETSSDMRDLLNHEKTDVRAAEAVALFCYQAKKWIGSFAAALGGLDTLIFAGGMRKRSARPLAHL